MRANKAIDLRDFLIAFISYYFFTDNNKITRVKSEESGNEHNFVILTKGKEIIVRYKKLRNYYLLEEYNNQWIVTEKPEKSFIDFSIESANQISAFDFDRNRLLEINRIQNKIRLSNPIDNISRNFIFS